MTKDEAMKLALGKIKSARECHPNAVDALLFEAEEILEEALAQQPAQQVQEPYCWMTRESKWRISGGGNSIGTSPVHAKKSSMAKIPLYLSSPQRTWVGLTEQQALDCFSPNPVIHSKNIEAKLKELNT